MNAAESGDDDQALPGRLLRFPSFLMLQLVKEARRIRGSLGGSPADDGLRAPHVTVLACLADFGPAAQRTISDRLGIDPSDLVSLLDDLERSGYATRRRDERDRRRYVVAVTAAGRRILRRHLGAAEKLNDRLLAPLSPAEREQLHALLLRVLAHHDPSRVPGRYRSG
ncbi:MarR family winged helix-turn-helix transcriptional regulator [Gandjariella thermophila]|nr:MarR family winged helix-turn-helix transcriptional regulator [Gandjariella thermophila]